MKTSRILVINSGSSSLKFAVFEPPRSEVLLSGLAERIGKENADLSMKLADGHKWSKQLPIANHEQALQATLDLLAQYVPIASLTGIGHRVVHGGEHFKESVLITEQVVDRIRRCNHLAPLHNPANIAGIVALQEQLSELPQVAVFDTAFHQTLPPRAFTYALPYAFYQEHGIRRYGFHGTSHRFVTQQTARLLNKAVGEINLVTAHLGNGCSASAVVKGQSVDTTMGLTPLEGLVMGTRSGDVDPGILLYLHKTLSYSVEDINRLLNRKSGLLGISEISNDMRVLLKEQQAGNKKAGLAIEIFCYRLAKCIASLAVAAYPLDALIFTGGIGENASAIRNNVCQQLQLLGISIDAEANASHGQQPGGCISAQTSAVDVRVVPTNEELMIAMDTHELIS